MPLQSSTESLGENKQIKLKLNINTGEKPYICGVEGCLKSFT